MSRPTSGAFRNLAIGIALPIVFTTLTHVTNVSARGAATNSESGQITALLRANELLASRVTQLEAALARLSVGPSRVAEPFEVVDKAGNVVFLVTADAKANVSGTNRVEIARGSGDNYVMTFRRPNGEAAAAIGEGKTGAGRVSVNAQDGHIRAQMLGEEGVVLSNSAGKPVMTLGLNSGKTASLLAIRGVLEIYDEAGNTVVDAGTLPDGRGAVRTWPNDNCKAFAGLISPTCLRGTKP